MMANVNFRGYNGYNRELEKVYRKQLNQKLFENKTDNFIFRGIFASLIYVEPYFKGNEICFIRTNNQ